MIRTPLLALVAIGLAGSAPAAQIAPARSPAMGFEPDAWSRPITWRTAGDWFATAVHATLMPDGRILFIGYARPTEEPVVETETIRYVWSMSPTPLGQPTPDEVVASNIDVPLDHQDELVFPLFVSDDLFCTGHTLTANGEFFSAGGSRVIANVVDGSFALIGLPYATAWNGTTWTRIPEDMQVVANLEEPGRWYPTCTRLADGRILVTGGYDLVMPFPMPNLSAEAYDPSTGGWKTIAPVPVTPPAINNPDYTHVFLLPKTVPGSDLLAFGAAGAPVFLTLTTMPPWRVEGTRPRPGTLAFQLPNIGASSGLLPLRIHDGEWGYHNGSVLVAGGQHGTTHMNHADVFDPVAGSWLPRIDLGSRRHHPSAVLLPDGRVLAIAGHDSLGLDPGVGRARYVDPARGFEVVQGRRQATLVRGYHTVSLLLPDGRVLVGGGRDHETGEAAEKATFHYYSPGYMRRERPVIETAPGELTFGAAFQVEASGKAPAEVVLMALGSMTHSIDMNQRYVQVETTAISPLGGGVFRVDAVAPADPRTAPPGHYMLFVLDDERTPSVARIVHLD